MEHVALVGHGLRSGEQVVGRSTWGRAAGTGAIQGSFVGGWFGLVFGLFDAIDTRIGWLALILWGVIYGAAIGALVGVAVHALRGKGHDFVSQSGLEAERYENAARRSDRAVHQKLGALADGLGDLMDYQVNGDTIDLQRDIADLKRAVGLERLPRVTSGGVPHGKDRVDHRPAARGTVQSQLAVQGGRSVLEAEQP